MSVRVFPPTWRGRYPHMREVDMPLWNRFLELYGSEFRGFAYDVRVGPPSGAAAGYDSQTQAVFAALTQLRIDAVGERDSELTLFEVKPYAGIGTVGQLIGYRDLYVAQFAPAGRVSLGVVTDRFTPAVGEVFSRNSISAWIV